MSTLTDSDDAQRECCDSAAALARARAWEEGFLAGHNCVGTRVELACQVQHPNPHRQAPRG